VEQQLADVLLWLEPRAFLLALALPPMIRMVGHCLPEELFMIAMGVLAARSDSPQYAATLLGLVLASHFVTDQAVYLGGCWLRPRLGRFPRIEKRLALATRRLEASPGALFSLIPARVFPLGRAAWLAGCGVVGVRWPRFAAVDLLALLVHIATWSGLGWWLAGDLGRLVFSAEVGRTAAVWLAVSLVLSVVAVVAWRRWSRWQPTNAMAVRWAADTLRRWTA
jgi:membrane protein DedA with SNARE-associated domain